MALVVQFADSPEGRAAIAQGIEEAGLRASRLHIVQTLSERPIEESSTQVRAWAEKITSARQAGDELVAQLVQAGIEATFEVDSPPMEPAAQVLDAARRYDADLIVIGIRRRSPVGKLLLGSVSQEVLLNSDCPVLAVKSANQE